MKELYDKFISLDAEARRKAHIKACTCSLAVWDEFCQNGKKLSYRDSVVLMKHRIEKELPGKALQAVIQNAPCKDIAASYLEPISALQDMDWEPPEHIKYAFYSIYNLYRKYCDDLEVDDRLKSASHYHQKPMRITGMQCL